MADIDVDQTEELGVRWPQASDKAFVETHPLRGAWAAGASDERLYRMIKGFHELGDLLVAEMSRCLEEPWICSIRLFSTIDDLSSYA